jgi:hypothetical protein
MPSDNIVSMFITGKPVYQDTGGKNSITTKGKFSIPIDMGKLRRFDS